MKNFRCLLAYEGTRYLGWQKTKMGASIEEELEKALTIFLRHPVTLQAASRTDAGVHARGQVVNFTTPLASCEPSRLIRAINALLPHDIRLLHVEEVVSDFHPTLHAVGKVYAYEICTQTAQSPFLHLFSWHFPYSLNKEMIAEAASALLGTHDFSSFCNEKSLHDKSPLCTIDSILIEDLEKGRWKIIVQGNRFLYKMMRNLVGSLVYAGCGKLAPSSMAYILSARDRRLAGMTAPAHGLYLQHVLYPVSS